MKSCLRAFKQLPSHCCNDRPSPPLGTAFVWTSSWYGPFTHARKGLDLGQYSGLPDPFVTGYFSDANALSIRYLIGAIFNNTTHCTALAPAPAPVPTLAFAKNGTLHRAAASTSLFSWETHGRRKPGSELPVTPQHLCIMPLPEPAIIEGLRARRSPYASS